MKIKGLKLLSLLLALTIFTVGCGEANTVGGDESNIDKIDTIDSTPVEGGQIILPLTTFSTLNPLITDNSYYFQFSKLIFEGLFEFDDNLEVVPKLAESYDRLNNGKTISIKIRDNIYWHDGEEFSTQDIAFTIDVIKYAKDRSIYGEVLKSFLTPFAASNMNYRIIDNKNIEIIYDKPYSNALEVLTFPIIPKHLFGNSNGANAYNMALEEIDYMPIGTGPYKFINYEKHKNIILEVNENYWNGKPYIEKVIGRVFEDEELILTAFETGQISFAPTIGVDWDKYRQNQRIKILEYTSSNYEFIGFNFNNPLLSGEKGSAIRQAINYGIDRQAIIEKVFLGHGTQVDVPIHPDSYLLSSEGYAYSYDIDRAKKLLSDVGYKEINDNGILIDEEGKPLSLRFTTNSFNPYRLRTAQLIVEYLRDLGIDIIVDYKEEYDEELTIDKINEEWEAFNSKIKKGDFDIVLLGWETSVITDLSWMFHSSQISGGNNFIGYNKEKMDQLLEDAYISMSHDQKLSRYKEIQKYIIEELPYVSLFFKNRGVLVDTKIVGELKPSFYNFYKGLENCFIPKGLQ